MVSFKQATILAIVGTALAAPLAHRGNYDGPYGRWGSNFGGDQSGYTPTVTNEGVTVTTEVITIPVNGGGRHHHYHPQGSDSTAQPESTPTADTGSGSGSSDTPSTGSGSSDTPSTGTSSGTGYMAVVSKWRSAAGLPALSQSSKLEGNALKTAQDGNGQMHHELNPGTMAQVLAPGSADSFEHVYVGGWLCEDTSGPGLNGICGSMTAGWDHSNGEKGHAEILTSKSYSNIGCALADGIWACDLA